MPPPPENVAVQGQLQDLRYVDMGYNDMAGDHPPLHGHRDHANMMLSTTMPGLL